MNPQQSNISVKSSDSIKTSSLLVETVQGLTGKDVQVGELLIQFQRRSYGGVFLILALLAIVPGISVFAGLAMLVPAFQLFIGMQTPVFPSFIQRRRIGVAGLQKWGIKISRLVERVETMVVPRWPVLSSDLGRRIIGLVILMLGFVVAIPFPFSNFPPAVAVIFYSLGLLEGDGLMIIIAAAVSIVAFIIGFTMFYLALNWLACTFFSSFLTYC